MYGWMGKILRVDLAREEITKEALPEEMVHKFVGGRGLNVKFLYDELKPGVDPLGPRNKIIIGAGPCNGTIVPGSTRFTVTFKSPLTGFIGDSNSGGTFGVTLKYAGYDMLIIEGKAKRPSYLWIDGDVVELRNGEALIGKTTGETRRELESELADPDISVVSIGPAGENLVKISCLIGDMGRAAGRSGGGAVFGSKNLKAIAIRGKKGVKVANVRLLEEVWQEMFRAWHDNPSIYENRARFGTGGGILNFQKAGILPTMNYRKGIYERLQDIGPQNLPDRYFIKQKACFSCPVPCQHVHVIGTGLYAGEYGEGLELAHLEHLGSRLLVDNLDLVVKASIDCDEYGLDVMEVGQLIGYAMECFENSILTPEDLGGLEIKWGNAEAAFRLIEMVACRKGIGDLFADGIKTASEKIGKGSEAFAHTVKGQANPVAIQGAQRRGD
jgi:aldehyde:ferredoxin oxidoreductase